MQEMSYTVLKANKTDSKMKFLKWCNVNKTKKERFSFNKLNGLQTIQLFGKDTRTIYKSQMKLKTSKIFCDFS